MYYVILPLFETLYRGIDSLHQSLRYKQEITVHDSWESGSETAPGTAHQKLATQTYALTRIAASAWGYRLYVQ